MFRRGRAVPAGSGMRAQARRTGLAAIIAVAGCGTPRIGLPGASVSACYRAIPVAEAAAHDKSAHLVGVHRVPVDRVEAAVPRPPGHRDPDTNVCAVVLRGSFAPGQVDGAPPTARGDYALVLIRSTHLTLLAAFVLDHVPPGFGGRLLS